MRKGFRNILFWKYMEIFGNEIQQKLSKKYCCKFCHYNTDRKCNFDSHLSTSKHNKEILGNKNKQIQQKTSNLYECEFCYKVYNTNSGLWKHKKICKDVKINDIGIQNVDISNKDDLILMLLKQNSELLEIVKNGTNNTTNTNCNNHFNNKTFNLQFFLNETCKNAMNITDFIDSIKIQLSDLERIGEIGYIEGISNIITNNLKALDITERPIHCTDKKRDVLYVKQDDKWEKEDKDKPHLRKLIKNVTNKNISLIPQWKKQNPECTKSYSKKSDICNKIIIEAMGGKGNESNIEKEDKIIKNISKNVTIDKAISE